LFDGVQPEVEAVEGGVEFEEEGGKLVGLHRQYNYRVWSGGA
jgi:hypothetical protein